MNIFLRLILLLPFLLAVGSPLGAEESRARYLMGTVCELVVSGPKDAEERAIGAAFDEISRLEQIFSLYRDDSEISQLNRSRVGSPFRPSADLGAMIALANRYREMTLGAFDATIEPMAALIRGGRWTDAEWEMAAKASGADKWRFNADGTVVRLDPMAGLNFDGIAKGYALDRAADAALREGAKSVQFNFGGQILRRGAGSSPVLISCPADRSRVLGRVEISEGSAATSSQAERRVLRHGRHTGHIIDPRRSQTVASSGAVTVIARSGAEADVLSTALFVLGREEGLQLLNSRFPDASAVFAEDPDGTWSLHASSGIVVHGNEMKKEK